MTHKPYILDKFIYTPREASTVEETPSFLDRHRLTIGITLSLVLHLCFYSIVIYKRYVAPFDLYDIVDRDSHIEWVTLNDPRFQPLKNPGNLFAVPQKTLSLEEMERRRLEEEKRKAARKVAEDAKKSKEDKTKEDKTKDEDQKKATDTDQSSKANPSAKTEPPATPPKFGEINTRPIKEIVGQAYEKYKQGALKVDNAVFSITLTFKVLKDGSVTDVKLVQSSNSPEIDEAALNVVNAVSQSHALRPLSELTSMTITLDNGPSLSNLRVTGFASQAEDASTLATVFSAAVVFGEYKHRETQPDVAELFKNMQVKADGKRLTGTISMTRSQVSALMRKGFAVKTT